VDNGVLKPARELAAPARGSAQQLDPRRHGFPCLRGGGLPLFERGRILVRVNSINDGVSCGLFEGMVYREG
jgi:hypothetical protein